MQALRRHHPRGGRHRSSAPGHWQGGTYWIQIWIIATLICPTGWRPTWRQNAGITKTPSARWEASIFSSWALARRDILDSDLDHRNTHLPNGMAPDLEAECRHYEDTIREVGGIDLQLLGIGKAGHIGFRSGSSQHSSAQRDGARLGGRMQALRRHHPRGGRHRSSAPGHWQGGTYWI